MTCLGHKKWFPAGLLGTTFPESFVPSSPDGSADTQRDQGQRRLQPEVGGTGHAVPEHRVHLRGPVQEGRSLLGGKGCSLEGLGGEVSQTIYVRTRPPGAWLQQVTHEEKPLGLAAHNLCGQQVTVPSLGAGTEAQRHDVTWPKLTHGALPEKGTWADVRATRAEKSRMKGFQKSKSGRFLSEIYSRM